MNITILKDTNTLIKDGVAAEVDFTTLPSNLWAVQWYGSSGEVEYTDSTPNLIINDISEYQSYIDLHTLALQAEAEAEAEAEALEISSRSWHQKRRDEYPSIGDQLDSLFHDGVFSVDMAAKLQSVKDKYPKP